MSDHRDDESLAPDIRPITDRPHGGVRDPEHAEFFDIDKRNLRHPDDDRPGPERALVVDDYSSQVQGAGSRTQADLGGRPPADTGGDAREGRPDAEPGST
jgi:hypothetical protein